MTESTTEYVTNNGNTIIDNTSIDNTIDQLIANKQVQQFVSLVTNHLKANATNYQISQSRSSILPAFYQYEGKRDIFNAAGYTKTLQYDDYMGYFRRGGVAKRIVESMPESTWRLPPEIKDGQEGDTEFTRAWKSLVNFGQRPGTLSDQGTIWNYILRADILSGIGQYGGLVIGLNDGQSLDKPLTRADRRMPGDLLYLSPYDEINLAVEETETSTYSRRFGLPKTYSLATLGDGDNQQVDVPVHWERVIHIAEGLLNDEIYGTPRLDAPYNYLSDLIKVTAASGESAWQLMNKGIIASTRDGYSLPSNTDDITAAMESFMNELQKTLQLQGMEVTVFGGEIVDPTGVIKSIISLISATTRIPQRILLGAEAGQLASSMDEINWANTIRSRQSNYAEAVILRPLINRFIYCGLLPQPQSGEYKVVWPSQLSLTDLELADKISREMSAMASAVGEDKMPVETFLREMLGWSDSQIARMHQARLDEIIRMMGDFVGG